jgi:ssRNA-specific RNase YbeY (16S rRNA maturation enzyme)
MKKVNKPNIHLEIASVPWKKVRGLTKRLETAAALTLSCLSADLLPVARGHEATLLLTTDKAVQTLTANYRGKDKPTNVFVFSSV